MVSRNKLAAYSLQDYYVIHMKPYLLGYIQYKYMFVSFTVHLLDRIRGKTALKIEICQDTNFVVTGNSDVIIGIMATRCVI